MSHTCLKAASKGPSLSVRLGTPLARHRASGPVGVLEDPNSYAVDIYLQICRRQCIYR